MADKLRVGVLVESERTPAWVHRMVTQIIASDFANLSLVASVEVNADGISVRLGRCESRDVRGSGLVRRFLESVQGYLMERGEFLPDALALKPIEELVPDTARIHMKTVRDRGHLRVSEEGIQALRRFDLDVIVHMIDAEPFREAASAARFGLWHHQFGDSTTSSGSRAGFWETMESQPTTHVRLLMLQDDAMNGVTVYESLASTDIVSLRRNRNKILWKASSFVPRALRRLQRQGRENVLEQIAKERKRPAFDSRQCPRQVTNHQLTKLLVGKVLEKARGRLRSATFDEQYCLFIQRSTRYPLSFRDFTCIPPPRDRSWADPHVLEKDGTYYVFLEEFHHKARKGHISLLTIDKDGRIQGPVTVLERPYHLAYPFVFEWGGQYFMLPESSEAGAVSLYQCTEFPLRWELRRNLLEGVKAFDSTLLRHDGKWWMFTNMVENEGGSDWDELFLFYSDDLESEHWVAHPMNPIVSDVTNARPAGRIFEQDGGLYRPAQDCSRRYGYAFNINEITTLSVTDYEERIIARATPDWDKDLEGIHTFSSAGDMTMIDGLVRRRKLKFPWPERVRDPEVSWRVTDVGKRVANIDTTDGNQ